MTNTSFSNAAWPAVLLACIGLAACGGRDARPVPSTTVSDRMFDCVSITREFEANERQIVSTIRERDGANAKNAILAVTSIVIFLPAVFFMDPKSPEKIEIDALRNRNGVLEELARSKRCPRPQTQLADVYRRLDDMPETPPDH